MDVMFEIIFPIIFVSFFVLFFSIFIISIFKALRSNSNVRKVNGRPSGSVPHFFTDQKADHNDPHDKQVSYSHVYSQKSHDSGIKDKPLSEAERNVLYGK